MADRGTAIVDLEAIRRRFPSLESLTYFNSGSYGLLADSVRDSFEEYLQSRAEKGADWHAWVERGERVRAKIANLLNADGDEIALTASASAGMNSVGSALDFSGSRNRLVLSNYEFPTSGQIWLAQQMRGAAIAYVPENEDRSISIDRFEELIDERTKLVALSHVCYRHGGKIPADTIRRVVEVAHRNGALVILDCYQSVGAEPIDLRALGVDFAVGGMLKYLLGTAGVGFLYVRREVVDELIPVATGWFAQADTGAMDMFVNAPHPTARRFQAGTPPVPSCYAADAGLDIILEVGIKRIADRIADLTGYAIEHMRGEEFTVVTPLHQSHRGPMLALKAKDENALVQALIDRKIVTSSRDGNVRAGFHFYNNKADVDRLLEGLTSCRELLA